MVFHSLTQENMRDVVKIMVKPLIAALAEKHISLKFQPSALKYLSEAGYDVEMGLAHFVAPCKQRLRTG